MKKRMTCAGLLGVALLALAGCATPTSESVTAKWKGKNIAEAMQTLGPPTSTMPLPGNMTMYAWEEHFGAANAPVRGYCRTGLHVDATGTIVEASQVSKSLLCR